MYRYPRNVVFNEGQRGQDSLRNILRWYVKRTLSEYRLIMLDV